ncbi:MAG: decarboxylating NADP(+)-dependent phosphogluconate dehydrogenase [Thermoguttaceae bacterium]|nr:decarboxylating NADP(+)-dependent phosphogluconate dehydrogenase [Thermoguttaceae bacterium]MDW8078173.1 decarboxylating NADP(+)-dependent phosphogluconate dehydrogenase [Thermoguttaceae bacterium]
MPEKCDIGLMGLAVMGQNLVLNMEDHGFSVAVFNRTVSKVDEFMARPDVQGRRIVGCHSLEELVANLSRPRKVMLMIQSGDPVPAPEEKLYPELSAIDAVVDQLCRLLEPGDVIIDGGNTHFKDTERRTKYVESRGFLYIGTGVSGGEEGARHGPSMMPGGSPAAWPLVKPIFQAIAAKVGPERSIPCCDWVGPRGAGHYVKMVHNGIEYGDMQLIAEAYWIMKNALGLSNAELHDVFSEWYQGELNSYLIEITRDIFTVKDDETGQDLVDLILDSAGAKGTGKWMSQNALDLGIPSTLVTEAVYARALSALKDARLRASKVLPGPNGRYQGDRKQFIEQVRQALYASKICSYAQGFAQMRVASAEYQWDLNFGNISLLWRGGCIIRAVFLERIKEAFDADPNLENLLLAPYFREAVAKAQGAWRHVVKTAIDLGIPTPAFSAALAYYDGYRSERLPANLIQAQRDYFGAHTYRRIDKPGAGPFHTDWLRKRRLPG